MHLPIHFSKNAKSIFYHATYATLNGSGAIFLASFGLTHFEKQVKVKIEDTSFNGNHWNFQFPPHSMQRLSQSINQHITELLGPTLSPYLLNIAASVSLLTSLYFASESIRHLKVIWKTIY